MPNFGFEVMARAGTQEPMPTMRHWISCSEPTYPATLERFMQATDADPSQLSTCYGMAENVFAVSRSTGLRIFEHDERRYVSCGQPIAGTEIKFVDDELFVRSPHSIQAYEGGVDIRDAQGFYATGDLGFLVDGEVVITGRKQDLANVAGRKYLLNELDFALGQVFPESAGRIASIAVHDSAGGTEKVLFLIENDRFWEKERSAEPAKRIREATGVEWIEVHFVPRRFITKTSSGKIHRKKTLEDWQACQSFRGIETAPRASEADLAQELRDRFPGIAADSPVGEQLDSLGMVMLRLFCEEHGIEYAPELTLERIAASARTKVEFEQGEVFSIVALADGLRLGLQDDEPLIDAALLSAIAKRVGKPVRFEHVAAPPAPVLFSDLIFHDYFLPRNPDPAYGVVSSLLKKIKEADLILVDDEDNFWVNGICVYPVLDRQFAIQPEADLLGHRLQLYTRNHHLLPRQILLGKDITPESIFPTLKNMESYLGIPILKMAFHEEFRAYTENWDFCDYRASSLEAERMLDRLWWPRFRNILLEFIERRVAKTGNNSCEAANRLIYLGTRHFCSFLLNRSAVDFVTDRYSSFCILGSPSSLPYLQRRLESLEKPYFFASRVEDACQDYECLIATGGISTMPKTDKPFFDFISAREDFSVGRPHNVNREIYDLCPPLAACDEARSRAMRDEHGETSLRLLGNALLTGRVRAQLPASL